MLPPRRSTARLLVAAFVVAAGACSDQAPPTAVSVVPNAAAGPGPNANTKVKVKQFQLSSNTLRLEGPSVTAQVSIGNSGPAYNGGVSLRAEIVQGTATRVAANLPAKCLPGDPDGFLSTSSCDMTFPLAASNFGAGNGTLVAGLATVVLHVVLTTAEGVESELANKNLGVNLVATPTISSLEVAPATLVIDGSLTSSYTVGMLNPASSLQGVALQAWITQGTTTHAAGGTVVTCGSNPGVFPPGPCMMTVPTAATNPAGVPGTLQPGKAKFELRLFQSIGGTTTTLDSRTVDITLIQNTPRIVSLSFGGAASIEIGGPSADYTLTIGNPGPEVDNVYIQGELRQDQSGVIVTGGAGGTILNTCGQAAVGVVPSTGLGTCSTQFTANASAGPVGNGTFQPGPARLVVNLYRAPPNAEEIAYDSIFVDVTLRLATPTIESITPASSYVVLDKAGMYTEYTALIDNPGAPRTTVLLQGWIRQGAARRAAGGAIVTCVPTSPGTLPSGPCSFASVISANNGPSSGTGTLVPGPATFELELKQNDGTTETILDMKTIPITLVANTPSIVSISLSTTTLVLGSPRYTYSAVVYNPTGANLSGVFVQEWIDQGSATRAAGGTSVSCGGGTGVLLPGSCVVSFTYGASNAATGTGFLTAGPASFRLQLFQSSTLLDTKTVAVTLVNP